MISHKTIKTFSVIASAAMIVGAFAAGPADAKKKKKKGCATYVPSEWSTDVPVTMVTDEHTAEAPLVVEVDTAQGLGSSSNEPPADDPTNPISRVFLNVQVDSGAPQTGLYATLEYSPPVLDYDLYVRDNAGMGLAYSAGFLPGVPVIGGTGNGGHTGLGTENIDGLTTNDCTGYLVDIISAATPGGPVTLKLWLGDPAYVPGG